MKEVNKIFGIGMSKTGTTTLARCFEILGTGPHKSFDLRLKKWVKQGKDLERVFAVADRHRSFEDSPWYLIYRELDQRYPGSKFILTVRKDSLTHAKSSWAHGVRRGVRRGDPSEEYINEKIRVYQSHNQEVMEYFKDRPEDLLVLCWEKGDDWDKICRFLGTEVPADPIPHCNTGRYRGTQVWIERLRDSYPYMMLLRFKYFLSQRWLNRKVKEIVFDRMAARLDN